jgi:OmpA-OmpF porin, OOP family
MKKISIFTVVIMLIAFVTAARAAVTAGSVSVTPSMGGIFFEGNQDLRTSDIYGLRLGYNFTKNIGVEGFFSYTRTEIEDESEWKPWLDFYSYGIEGLYHFMPDSRFVPFIAIGIGGIYYSEGKTYQYNPYYGQEAYGNRFESNRFAVDYGFGVKYFLTDNIALRFDVRHILPLNGKWSDPDYIHNDFMATLGINLTFGGEKKKAVEVKVEEPVAAAPAAPVVPAVQADPPVQVVPVVPVEKIVDSDKDGVPDNLDKCPDTPFGVAVDENGCPAIVEKKQAVKVQVPDKAFIAINLKFDTGKAVVKKKYYKAVKKLADFMKEHPETKITIHGYTDTVGTKNFNVRLSKARAKSVRQCLINNFGIKASRITAVGYGMKKPMASNKTSKGRQKNRRIEAGIEAVLTK